MLESPKSKPLLQMFPMDNTTTLGKLSLFFFGTKNLLWQELNNFLRIPMSYSSCQLITAV